jgi:NAD(P)-dependent dehydrogenase (short-subunit alcohol dehydrogenase family)
LGRIDGTTVVVTGVASGIGRAPARRLLDDGAAVVGCDPQGGPEQLDGPGGYTFVAADVTDDAAVSAVFDAAPGRIAGVVHSAGVARSGAVHKLELSKWQRVIGVNFTGTFLAARAAVTDMLTQEWLKASAGRSSRWPASRVWRALPAAADTTPQRALWCC